MKIKYYNASLWLAILILAISFVFYSEFLANFASKTLYYEQLVLFFISVLISVCSLLLLKYWPNFQATLQLFASIIIFGLLLQYGSILITSWSKSLTIPIVFINAVIFEFLIFLSLNQLTNLITNKAARIISELILLVFIPASSLTLLFPMAIIKYNSFTHSFILTGLFGTLLFIPVVVFLRREWQLAPITFRFSVFLNWSCIVFLILVCTAFVLWSRYHAGTNIWDSLFQYSNHWAPHYSLNYFLTYIEAGVAEELTFRYLIFFTLYKGLVKLRGMQRLGVAFLVSTFLFASMHFLNIATYGFSYAGGVLFQFLLAFFTGAMFLTSYLYTGSILVPIIFHFAYDTFGVAASPATDLNALTLIIDKQAGYPLMYYIIAIIFVAYFMSGSRLQVVKQNLQAMCPSGNDLLL